MVFAGIFEFRRDKKKNSLWANSWVLLITRLLKLLPKRIFTSAHETSFLGLLTKRVPPIFFFHRTSAYETSFHETSFLRLLTKRVFMTRFLTRALRTLISIGFKNQKVCEDELFWINNQNIGFFSQFFSINHTGIDFSW